MNHKKITRTLLITVLSLLSCACINIAHAKEIENPGWGQQPPAGQFDPNMLSPEDLQAMEQAVEEERAKMSPEQRAQFDNDVEQLTKELEQMKPEELEAFMNQVLFGQPAPEEIPQEVVPAPTSLPAQVVAPKPEPAKPQKPRKKQDEAISRIDSIIRSTNSFLNKVAIMIDYPAKLKKWAEQGKIRGWKQNYSWDSVKKQLEELVHKLNKIKDIDPKTKDYKYINDLIDDESLYNNLGKLHDSLSDLEPQIEVDDFGIEPVSKESRQAIRQVLGQYIEAFDALGIPADLEKIIAKYDPTAKKIYAEEEQKSKKALEDSKIKRKTVPAVVGGKGDKEDRYNGSASAFNPFDYSSPYTGGYSPYTSPYTGSSSDYNSPYSSGTDTEPHSTQGGGKSGQSGEAADQGDSKSGSAPKGGGGSAGGQGIQGSNSNPSKSKEEQNTEKFIDDFKEALSDANQKIDDGRLTNVGDQLKSSPDQTIEALDGTGKSIMDAVGKLNKLRKATLSQAQKKQLQAVYGKYKPKLDKTLNAINNISADTSVKAAANALSGLKGNIELLHAKFNEAVFKQGSVLATKSFGSKNNGNDDDGHIASDVKSGGSAPAQAPAVRVAHPRPAIAARPVPAAQGPQAAERLIASFENKFKNAMQNLELNKNRLNNPTLLKTVNTLLQNTIEAIDELGAINLTDAQKNKVQKIYDEYQASIDAKLAAINTVFAAQEAQEDSSVESIRNLFGEPEENEEDAEEEEAGQDLDEISRRKKAHLYELKTKIEDIKNKIAALQ